MLASKILHKPKTDNSAAQKYFERARVERRTQTELCANSGPRKGNAFVASELSEQIIGSYQTCLNEGHSNLMQELARQSLKSLADKHGVHLQKMQEEATFVQAGATLLEKVFQSIRAFSIEYNHAIGWNDLYVTCTKPASVTEVLKYNIYREPLETVTTIRARFSTRSWTISARAAGDVVEFFLLPAVKAIGLSRVEKQYEPILKLKGLMANNEVFWQMDSTIISADRLEKLALEMFSKLVVFSQESLNQGGQQVQTATQAA